MCGSRLLNIVKSFVLKGEILEDAFVIFRGYSGIVYYADHPAAITICRKEGTRRTIGKKNWQYARFLLLFCCIVSFLFLKRCIKMHVGN